MIGKFGLVKSLLENGFRHSTALMASRIVDLPVLFWPTSGVKSLSGSVTSSQARKFWMWIFERPCMTRFPLAS